jgi:1-pyrroline-5-carboxylate dehydrogenase
MTKKRYFIEPTVILTTNPKYSTMETELFGPVVTIYVYEDAMAETLELVDTTSEYALTVVLAKIVTQLKKQ